MDELWTIFVQTVNVARNTLQHGISSALFFFDGLGCSLWQCIGAIADWSWEANSAPTAQ